LICILIIGEVQCCAQFFNPQRVRERLANAKDDTSRVNTLIEIGWAFTSNPDSALMLAQQGLQIAQSIGYKKGEMTCKTILGYSLWTLGDYATAIRMGTSSFEDARLSNDTVMMNIASGVIANSYRDQGDYADALRIHFEMLGVARSTKLCSFCSISTANIGSDYFGLREYDSALRYLNKSLTYTSDGAGYDGWIYLMLGQTWAKLENEDLARENYQKSINTLLPSDNQKDLAGAYIRLADLLRSAGQTDSATIYAQKALELTIEKKFRKEEAEAYITLSETYDPVDPKEALRYLKLAVIARDSLHNLEKHRQVLTFRLNEQLRQQEIDAATKEAENRIRTNALLGSTFTLAVVALLLYINSRQKQKGKQRIETAFKQLKATQNQLIQSEKMASLGELTAGIAHEIQNPLNFVNNFSELNSELVDELERAALKGDIGEVKTLAKGIKENEEKIVQHGKRADGIVKSMLQHSRTSSSQKELTDINNLCDEYVRLAYHGMRAKDKTFNAIPINIGIETEFDPTLPKVNLVPQEIGRVVLNLINNAFYAVKEKQKTSDSKYEPQVSVITSKRNQKVEVRVVDNGVGIPESTRGKVFQPFFTTKPAGQGTGLGLSLSYDIIKAHGGEITLQTVEGSGSVFTIRLPAG
jgi:signal transduction histidine kinase